MPKLIDHARRREELAEAAWRVLLRDGVGRVSVRSVATEAGLTVSSLRHVFSSQDELLAFSLQLVLDRVGRRVEPMLPVADRRGVEAVAAQFLPLDPERCAEMEVYLSLFMAARANPELIPLREEAQAALRRSCRNLIGALDNGSDLAPGADLELEARRLHALLDGLAMHLVFEGGDGDPDGARRLLRAHLDSLAA
ncbi:TetR/AcrR family transcriptional regulator [Brachybacterium fresconis]|uniref:AcrR family transcriptional regulator n=1 Tax=Brachybacterium fresconis TaxID=173363 RepID=A0ABS4YP08_9MICO|nr:TetR family transcriptional regulator C-terminal domain-containing protein [Brachybacterium fresconis]MBP2410325.1 AcrR family transcriptional regulator [Brachybacterium fresconis]